MKFTHVYFLSLSLFLFASQVSSAEKPNIVLVVTDDQAPWAFAEAVRSGEFSDVPIPATPHMDRLAREGARFNNFFCTTPVCSPARSSLMTGRYASTLGIKDFIPQPGHKLFDPNKPVALDPETTTTIAEVLKAAGYQTGLVGKWHLGDWTANGAERLHPTNHGFDYFMGLTGGGTTPDNPELEEDGVVRQFEGLTTDILTDRAISFVKHNSDKPFFLCLATRAPHGRWLPVAPADWAPYEQLDPRIPDYPGLDRSWVKDKIREYLASTSGVDRNLGRLLSLLDDLKLTEKTVVIFTSDHGYNMGHNGIWHKGNGIWATKKKPPGKQHNGTRVISKKYRPNLYDHSLRVPAIIRWPSHIDQGTVLDQTASSLDLLPTLAAIAGVDKPSPQLTGRNLIPLLTGNPPEKWNNDFYAEYDMIHYAVASLRCYRTPKFKLIRDDHNSGRDEFYNLKTDPVENRNLIDSSDPEIQMQIQILEKKLRSFQKSIR